MADLKTDYVNDVLDTDVNTERTYNIVDSQGNIIYANARIRETTVFTTEGEPYGAPEINEQNTVINGLKTSFSQTLADLKATAIAQAVGVTVSDTFAQVIAKLGAIVNRGKVTQSLNTSTKSYTIPAGYHNGEGTVSITTQEKTVTGSRSAQTVTPDSGKVLSKVTVNKFPDASGNYPTSGNITSNGTFDMGASNNYRYVKVNVHPTPSCILLVDEAITSHTGGTNRVTVNVPSGYQRYILTVGIHRSNNDSIPQVDGCGAIFTGSNGKLYDSTYREYMLTSSGSLSMWTNTGWLMWYTIIGINS